MDHSNKSINVLLRFRSDLTRGLENELINEVNGINYRSFSLSRKKKINRKLSSG